MESTSTNLEISKIETRLETTRQFVSRYADDTKLLIERQKQSNKEIARILSEIGSFQKRISALSLGSDKLGSLLSVFDLTTFDVKSGALNRRRNDLDAKMDRVSSDIRETTTEITRIRGETREQPEARSGASSRLRSWRARRDLPTRSKFLLDTAARLEQLLKDLDQLKVKEAETLDRAAKYQPLLDSLDSSLKSLKMEEESVRKNLAIADREYFSANNDLSRYLESERSLVGELAMLRYAEPVEVFEGVDELLKETPG